MREVRVNVRTVTTLGPEPPVLATLLMMRRELSPLRRHLSSVHNPGWDILHFPFPENTPEESDDGETLHENRPKCEKLGEGYSRFSTRFHLFPPLIPDQERCSTP